MKKYLITTAVVMFALAPVAYGAISDYFEGGWDLDGTPGAMPAEEATDWTVGATAAANSTWTGTSLIMTGDPGWGAYYSVTAGSPLHPVPHGEEYADWGVEYRFRLRASNKMSVERAHK